MGVRQGKKELSGALLHNKELPFLDPLHIIEEENLLHTKAKSMNKIESRHTPAISGSRLHEYPLMNTCIIEELIN